MNTLVTMTLIGLLASSAMISFLWLISGLTQTHCDMVRAVGSLYTHREDNSLFPGLLMQFTAGLLMAYVYGVFLDHAEWRLAYAYAGAGMLMGLLHGTVVSLILAKLVGEHHPVERYRHVTTKVVFAHLFAHILYGLIIGTMYGTYIAL